MEQTLTLETGGLIPEPDGQPARYAVCGPVTLAVRQEGETPTQLWERALRLAEQRKVKTVRARRHKGRFDKGGPEA